MLRLWHLLFASLQFWPFVLDCKIHEIDASWKFVNFYYCSVLNKLVPIKFQFPKWLAGLCLSFIKTSLDKIISRLPRCHCKNCYEWDFFTDRHCRNILKGCTTTYWTILQTVVDKIWLLETTDFNVEGLFDFQFNSQRIFQLSIKSKQTITLAGFIFSTVWDWLSSLIGTCK